MKLQNGNLLYAQQYTVFLFKDHKSQSSTFTHSGHKQCEQGVSLVKYTIQGDHIP